MSGGRPRILLGRFELDGHDRGILAVMNALRNAGMEVVYVHFSDAKEIVQSVIEEDVDLIGITSSLGEHIFVSSLLLEELNKAKVNVPVILGGVIPNMDVPKLLDIGVRRVFGPGSAPQEVVSFVSQIVEQRR